MKKTYIVFLLFIVLAFGAGVYVTKKDPAAPNTTSTTNNPSGSSTPAVESGGVVANYSNKQLTSFPKNVLSQTNTTSLLLNNNALTGALPSEIQK